MKRRPPSPVRSRIEGLEREMVSFAAALCAIPTVNPPGQRYEECAEFLAAKTRALGMSTRLVRVPAEVQARVLPGFEAWPRVSVVARWDVGAPQTLHFTGHYDVVPATAGWKTDPFRPVERRGRLIARGADDMKSSITAAIFAVQALMGAGVRPPWNIELSFTPDEETGGELGLGYLVTSGAIRPDAAILCEGGQGLEIGYAHKGVLWLDVTVHGKSAHACVPQRGVNALYKAAPLIQRLLTLEKVYARRGTRFQVRKPEHRRPTIMIGGVAGGGAKVNTIPDRFHFTIDRRLNPEDRMTEVRAEILRVIADAKRADPGLRVTVETLLHVPPGWTDLETPFCRLAQDACRAVLGRTPRFTMTPGFTDLHFLTQDLGIPAVMYGASGGKGHADGEYATVASIVQTCRIYAEIALHLQASVSKPV
jgi:succinyl-diaminopimelate desuccinylase